VIIAEIRGSDGSLLDSDDCITDAVDDMEELVGVLERLSASLSSTSHAPSALGSFKSHRSDAAAAGPPNRSSEGGGEGGGGGGVAGGGGGVGVGAGGGHNTDSYGGGDDAHVRGGGIDEGSMLDASNVMSAGDEQLDLWASDKLRTVPMSTLIPRTETSVNPSFRLQTLVSRPLVLDLHCHGPEPRWPLSRSLPQP
jgi:hypothetical protein